MSQEPVYFDESKCHFLFLKNKKTPIKTKCLLEYSILVASQLASATRGCCPFGFHVATIRRGKRRMSRDARGELPLARYMAHLYNAVILYNPSDNSGWLSLWASSKQAHSYRFLSRFYIWYHNNIPPDEIRGIIMFCWTRITTLSLFDSHFGCGIDSLFYVTLYISSVFASGFGVVQ